MLFKKKKYIIPFLLVLLVVSVAGYLIMQGRGVPSPLKKQAGPSPEEVKLKTEYQNPFDNSSQYVNPFEGYINPFDAVRANEEYNK